MRKVWLCALILGLSVAVTSGKAEAISIGFDPVAQTVNVKDLFSIALTVSGLGDGVAPSLSTFDVDVLFDGSLFGFADVVFGDQLDLSGFGSRQAYTLSTGTLNLFELSLDDLTVLDKLQAGSFVLASLSFNALADGTGAFQLKVNALGDSSGDPLAVDQLGSASVAVGASAPVPEPSTLLLIGSGLAGLMGFRRRLFR